MKPKLTKWFYCCDKLPTIPGWYEVKWGGQLQAMHFFNGKRWTFKNKGAKSTFGVDRYAFSDQWRGLAEQPK